MRRFIIIGAILASTALLVLLAHERAFTQENYSSTQMRITVVTKDGSFVAKDELGRPGRSVKESVVVDKYKGEEVLKVYKYTKNPKCTVYCSGGDCWEFCW